MGEPGMDGVRKRRKHGSPRATQTITCVACPYRLYNPIAKRPKNAGVLFDRSPVSYMKTFTRSLALGFVVAASTLAAADSPVVASPPAVPAVPAPATIAPAEVPGLKVGEKAPNFILPTAAGDTLALSTLLARGKVALVFVRSVDWCPFCRTQLQAIEAALPELTAAGVQIVSISYDAPAALAAAQAKLGLTFPLLSDTGSRTIDAFGIRNHEAKGRGVGVPHPVVFVLDAQGIIQAKLLRDGFRERPESVEILAAAQAIP